MATAEPHPGKSPTVCNASRPDEGLRIIDSGDEAHVATSLDDCSATARRWPWPVGSVRTKGW
jgi:hypothetical protein